MLIGWLFGSLTELMIDGLIACLNYVLTGCLFEWLIDGVGLGDRAFGPLTYWLFDMLID